MIKLFFLALILFSFSNHLSAQNDVVTQLNDMETKWESLLPYRISNDKGSDDFRKKLDEWVEYLDKYLEKGSGLTFDDMNLVRVLRKRAKAIAEFTWLGQAERNCGWAPGDIVTRIKEVYPDISITTTTNSGDKCVELFRFQLGDYVFFTATHRDTEHIKRAYYKVRYSSLSTANGYCGVQPYKLTKICDNGDNLKYQSFTPIIVRCEELENVLKRY